MKDVTESQCANGSHSTEKSDPSSLLSKGDGADGQCHQVEEIIGCTEWKGQLVFLVKWVNEPDQQVVPAAIANVKYPQVSFRGMSDWANERDFRTMI